MFTVDWLLVAISLEKFSLFGYSSYVSDGCRTAWIFTILTHASRITTRDIRFSRHLRGHVTFTLLPSFWCFNCHNYLGFSRLAFEHPTFRVRGERSTKCVTELIHVWRNLLGNRMVLMFFVYLMKSTSTYVRTFENA